MENIIIYSKPNCSWCTLLKELLFRMNLPYFEYLLGENITKEELIKAIGNDIKPLLVPQIYIQNQRIGGYKEFIEYCQKNNIELK